MDHFLKVLAQHWHLDAAQYVHLHLLSAMSLVPLLAILYLVLFDKRRNIGSGAVKIQRRITTLTRRSTTPLEITAVR
jgi:hypothetical protein